ncbi:glycosyltransferase 87 family protein [Streptomyces sp. NPDC127068]|uniref:glycosyltransferase 87 family protein n=1 Tax=Streptomyces sp. NPDC127068 TaxID=3347127 RepID=UPI00364A7964
MTHQITPDDSPAPTATPVTLPLAPPRSGAHGRRTPLAYAAGWLATRTVMLLVLVHSGADLLGSGGIPREVHGLYARWAGQLSEGSFPVGDPLWQYPPGAGPVLLAPHLVPWLSYFEAFVALTLLADATVTAALVRAGTRPGRSPDGARLWLFGLPLLLHLPLARYDVQVTAFAVLGLLALARSPRTGGACAALGAAVKGWPVLALLGTPPGPDTRRAWTTAAATGGALLVLLAVTFRNPLGFLHEQGARGVQIESLGGTLLGFARQAGWPGTVRYRYGAMEFVGPYVDAVSAASLALTAAAALLLVVWRLRARHWTPATGFDAALCAVLLFTVTSRVISPQYLVWLLGLAAVCLTSRRTGQRPVAALVLAATALSTVIYPVLYAEVTHSTWTGCTLLLLRNGLLVAATALSFARLWRGTGAAAADAHAKGAAWISGTRSTPR